MELDSLGFALTATFRITLSAEGDRIVCRNWALKLMLNVDKTRHVQTPGSDLKFAIANSRPKLNISHDVGWIMSIDGWNESGQLVMPPRSVEFIFLFLSSGAWEKASQTSKGCITLTDTATHMTLILTRKLPNPADSVRDKTGERTVTSQISAAVRTRICHFELTTIFSLFTHPPIASASAYGTHGGTKEHGHQT